MYAIIWVQKNGFKIATKDGTITPFPHLQGSIQTPCGASSLEGRLSQRTTEWNNGEGGGE